MQDLDLKSLQLEEAKVEFSAENRSCFVRETAENLRVNNWFKACLPKMYGGKELNLLQFMELTEELAFLDANLGWRFQIGNGATYFVKNFAPDCAADLFCQNGLLIAGSGTPSGTIASNYNDYLVSGKWNYCSGLDLATHLSFVCKYENKERLLAGIIPYPKEAELGEIKLIGLKDTATQSISMEAFSVASNYIFSLDEVLNPIQIPAFDLPFDVFARAYFLPVIFGSFRRYLGELMDFLKSVGKPTDVVNYSICVFHVRKKELLNLLFTKDYIMFDLSVWKFVEYIRNELMKTIPLAGMHAVQHENAISANFLHLITLTQHHLLHAQPR